MSYKWIGAILIIVGCGGFGFSLAAVHRNQERTLEQLLELLRYMYSELRFRLTPLPELCRRASGAVPGSIGRVFADLAKELDKQVFADVAGCMDIVLKNRPDIPEKTVLLLKKLGTTLGEFDLDGQLQGFTQLIAQCETELSLLSKDRDQRLRSYQTLGLCAGAAVAIVLL